MGSDPRDYWFVLGGSALLSAGLYVVSRRDDGSPGRVIATTTDGSRIGEWGSGLRRRPPRARGLGARLAWVRGLFRTRLRENLEPGDLTDVRVREGEEGEAAWVVEGLDRTGDPFHLYWSFDSADFALAAFRALDARIARPPMDFEGQPLRLTDRQFDEWWELGDPASPPEPEPIRNPA